jgi:DNA-binding transcriptional LysR family regulator
VWKLRDEGGGETSIKLTARVAATSTEGVLAAAAAGLGVAATSLFACRAELDSGALTRVLGGHMLAPIDVHAIFPAGRRPTAKARAFVEHLAAGLAI